jgi:hypothetical protein
MQAECKRKDRPDLWGLFKAQVYGPIMDGDEPMPYEQVVSRFQLQSPTEANNRLGTARRMFRRALRAVVAEYTDGEEAVERELRDLQAIVGRDGG